MFIIRVNGKDYKTIKEVCNDYSINYQSVMNKRHRDNITINMALTHFIHKKLNKWVIVSCYDSNPVLHYPGYEDLKAPEIVKVSNEPEGKEYFSIIKSLVNLFRK